MHGLDVTAYVAGLSDSIYCIHIETKLRKFYVLPTQCFVVDLRTNSDYFPIQH
jgi:hypothetical protein